MKKNDPVRSQIAKGEIFDSKMSCVKIESGMKTLKFFANVESAKGYPDLAIYNVNGKNPFDGMQGKVLGLKFFLFGNDLVSFDFGAANKLNQITQFVNNAKVTVKLGKDEVRSFFIADGLDPLPQKLGDEIVSPSLGSIENERNVIRLPLNVADGVSLTIEAQAQAFGAGEALVNDIIACKLFVIESKTTDK